MSTCRRVFLSLVVLVSPFAVSGAQQIVPTSYTAPPGYTGNWPYLDETGSQLIDGVLGVAPLDATTAPPYVGWNTNPTVLFSFGTSQTIGQVRIGFYRQDALGLPLPPSVQIGSTMFNLAGNEIPDASRGWVTFGGRWTGSQLALTLFDKIPITSNPTGFTGVMVDEVQFFQAASSIVPEPTAVAMVGAGLALAGGWKARKRRSSA